MEYIASQGWDAPEVELFMGLKDGTLESLIHSECSVPMTSLAETVLHHILQAIDCLATHGIIHRDVKPENILYTSQQGKYHFQLGDFGLSNRQIIATTHSGTPLYMAPEMFLNGEQTHKVDVWSLFVTIIWTLNTRGFREASNGFKSYGDAQRMVLSTISELASIQEMAKANPEERASAAQMLIKCFNGEGLITPRCRVPPLATPEKAGGRIPATAAAPSIKPVHTNRRNLRKKTKPNTAAAPFRIEKARFPVTRPGRAIGLGTDDNPSPPHCPEWVANCRIPGGFPDDATDASRC